ncbi:hypothetical protein CCMSSC00406_0010225 [Pleurotus cornucopiae]|uniref:Uncharacterized protein n=1 Tax=Pleurotus cornucopiae TaxID=5321 RepID=A0ACB7IMH6_PLECO|nr:hypothetical protein CCMSSC00406_0010225 [Pleurotus cornucopiae]
MSHFRQGIRELIQEEFSICGVEEYLSSYLPFDVNDSDVGNVVQLLSKTASNSSISTNSVADFSLTDFPILDTPTSHEHLASLAEAIASCMPRADLATDSHFAYVLISPLDRQPRTRTARSTDASHQKVPVSAG